MKTTLYLAVFLAVGFFWSCQNGTKQETKANLTKEEIENTKGDSLLRHMVIFKFKESTSDEEVEKLNTAFSKLPDAIPEIQDFEWGLNKSPEDFDQDFTHCYLLTFDSEKDRDSIYAPHPAHKAFVESLGPHLEKVFVVDYWTNP